MICALFYDWLAGWTGETPPGAEGKREKVLFGKYEPQKRKYYCTQVHLHPCDISTTSMLRGLEANTRRRDFFREKHSQREKPPHSFC